MARKLKVLPLKFLGFLSLQGIIAIMKKDIFQVMTSMGFIGQIIEKSTH